MAFEWKLCGVRIPLSLRQVRAGVLFLWLVFLANSSTFALGPGPLFGFGRNSVGQIGNDWPNNAPTRVPALLSWITVDSSTRIFRSNNHGFLTPAGRNTYRSRIFGNVRIVPENRWFYSSRFGWLGWPREGTGVWSPRDRRWY